MSGERIGVAYPIADHDRAALLDEYPSCRLPHTPAPGSVPRPCARCHILVSVGPRLRAIVETLGLRLVCARCAFTLGMRQTNRGRAWC